MNKKKQAVPPWWQTSVIYQIYPRSYKDSSGNGVGDLKGVTEKLDYLSDVLGIDVIWLSPFYPSPMADFGYDVSNYVDVNPLFGDLEAFDQLVHQAHQRDLKVLIDFVPNHSSDQHPWFKESKKSKSNPKRNWYVWRDPKPDGSRPNNWLSIFGGPAWEWDEHTGQYYLHSFLKEQPDLNWRNPEVKQAMLDAMAFWLEREVDGFRIDVAHFLMKDPEERDNPVNTEGQQYSHKPMGEYDSQLHVYDHGHEDIHLIYREMRALLDRYSNSRPRFSIGEIHEFDWKTWASYYGEHLDELHMPFNFATLKAEWTASGIKEIVDGLEAALPEGAWPNYVLSNHDEPRLVTRYGTASARLAAMLLLTLRGTPTLYYGDEIGMQDISVSDDQIQDPWGKKYPELNRDGCRSPMQWNKDPQAGFSANPNTWLPVHPSYKTQNVAHQLDDPSSLLSFYQSLLAFRKQSPALQYGRYIPLENTPPEVFQFIRKTDGQTLHIALNFSDNNNSVQLDYLCDVLFSSGDAMKGEQVSNLILSPREGIILEKNPAR